GCLFPRPGAAGAQWRRHRPNQASSPLARGALAIAEQSHCQSAGSALHGQPAAGCLENRPRARSVEAAAARPAAPPLSLLRGRRDGSPARLSGLGFWFWVLDDALLSHGEAPHYHRRGVVSLLSSGWDQVVPTLYGRQAIRLGHRGLG